MRIADKNVLFYIPLSNFKGFLFLLSLNVFIFTKNIINVSLIYLKWNVYGSNVRIGMPNNFIIY